MSARNVVLVLIDTLRRDHLGAYGSEEVSAKLSAAVTTPHLGAFAARGALFENAFLGSFPCMPARRALWTGRCEVPWRGWGPLEDGDLDLFDLLRGHGLVTAMVSDHYHLLELDFGCMYGHCRACLVRLAAGRVQHEDAPGLTPEERREGFIRLCTARPESAYLCLSPT